MASTPTSSYWEAAYDGNEDEVRDYLYSQEDINTPFNSFQPHQPCWSEPPKGLSDIPGCHNHFSYPESAMQPEVFFALSSSSALQQPISMAYQERMVSPCPSQEHSLNTLSTAQSPANTEFIPESNCSVIPSRHRFGYQESCFNTPRSQEPSGVALGEVQHSPDLSYLESDPNGGYGSEDKMIIDSDPQLAQANADLVFSNIDPIGIGLSFSSNSSSWTLTVQNAASRRVNDAQAEFVVEETDAEGETEDYDKDDTIEVDPTYTPINRPSKGKTFKKSRAKSKSEKPTKRHPSQNQRKHSRKDEAANNKKPFICMFDFTGCGDNFKCKNEWKRHIITIHFRRLIWICPFEPCESKAFKRKDLMKQHFDRIHKLDPSRMTGSLDQNKHTIRDPPEYLKCSVVDCDGEFSDHRCLEGWLEHMGRHFLTEGQGSLRLENNPSFIAWALEQRIIIETVREPGNHGGVKYQMQEHNPSLIACLLEQMVIKEIAREPGDHGGVRYQMQEDAKGARYGK